MSFYYDKLMAQSKPRKIPILGNGISSRPKWSYTDHNKPQHTNTTIYLFTSWISNSCCQHIRAVKEDHVSLKATSLMLYSLRRSIKLRNYINCLIRWSTVFWWQISALTPVPRWGNFNQNIVQNSKLGAGLQNM